MLWAEHVRQDSMQPLAWPDLPWDDPSSAPSTPPGKFGSHTSAWKAYAPPILPTSRTTHGPGPPPSRMSRSPSGSPTASLGTTAYGSPFFGAAAYGSPPGSPTARTTHSLGSPTPGTSGQGAEAWGWAGPGPSVDKANVWDDAYARPLTPKEQWQQQLGGGTAVEGERGGAKTRASLPVLLRGWGEELMLGPDKQM